MAFGTVKQAVGKVEAGVDSLGGSGSGVVETGVYLCTVEMMYASESAGGANAVNLQLKTEDGRYIKAEGARGALYVTSGRAKDTANFYVKDGKQYNLPGWNLVNALTRLTEGYPLEDYMPGGKAEGNIQEKTIKLWDWEKQKELPVKKDVFTEMCYPPQLIKVAVTKIRENKQSKTGEQDANGRDVYGPISEERFRNEITHFFHAESEQTLAEAIAETDGIFIDEWKEKFDGVTKDNYKEVTGGAVAGAPKTTGTTTPTTPLSFSK